MFRGSCKGLGQSDCKCDRTQIVKAQAYGNADEFKTLVAKVEALAKSSVCVKGDDYEAD
jgi:hypothetical protein